MKTNFYLAYCNKDKKWRIVDEPRFKEYEDKLWMHRILDQVEAETIRDAFLYFDTKYAPHIGEIYVVEDYITTPFSREKVVKEMLHDAIYYEEFY